MNHKTIGSTLTLLGIILAAPSIWGMQTSFITPTGGSISMVKLYWDSNCTSEVTQIDWGSIIPGSEVNRTVYIKNFGGAPVNITLTTENWNPANAATYITFLDSYSGLVSAHFVQADTLLLRVGGSIVNTTISTFSFDIRVNEGW